MLATSMAASARERQASRRRASVWYVLAKLAELYNAGIYAATDHLVSGHTLKQVLAAASAAVILSAQWRGARPAVPALPRQAT